MTLPTTGKISLGDVNVELGLGRLTQMSLNNGALRTLAGKPSGQVKLSDLRGKTYVPPTGVAYQWTPIFYDGGSNRSLSGAPTPSTFEGVQFLQIYINKITPPIDGFSDYLYVNFSEVGSATAQKVKGIIIAGLTLTVSTYHAGDSKIAISIAQAWLTQEQSTHLFAELTGKTSQFHLIK